VGRNAICGTRSKSAFGPMSPQIFLFEFGLFVSFVHGDCHHLVKAFKEYSNRENTNMLILGASYGSLFGHQIVDGRACVSLVLHQAHIRPDNREGKLGGAFRSRVGIALARQRIENCRAALSGPRQASRYPAKFDRSCSACRMTPQYGYHGSGS